MESMKPMLYDILYSLPKSYNLLKSDFSIFIDQNRVFEGKIVTFDLEGSIMRFKMRDTIIIYIYLPYQCFVMKVSVDPTVEA